MILTTTAAITAIGLVCAVLLAIIDKKFGVKTDESVARIGAELPGANCGGCGYPGCAGYAEAIAHNDAPLNKCGPGGQALADTLARITGRAAGIAEPVMAVVRCGGDKVSSKRKNHYNGLSDCASAALVAGGWKECAHGCLGFASCVRVCPHGAIDIIDGVAVVNPAHCGGCGVCAAKCPRSLISIVPKSHRVHILCNSPEKGATVNKTCSRGCIGCGICVKTANSPALKMNAHLAVIDYTQTPLTDENIVNKCPKKCMRFFLTGNK